MKTFIPAICENPKCGEIFTSASIVPLNEGSSVYFEDTSIGPCPKCGGFGLVPNGLYTNASSAIKFTPQSADSRSAMERALLLVREAAKGGMTPEAFQKAAQERAPELSALWKLTPTTASEAHSFWMLVITTLYVILVAIQTFRSSNQQLAVPKEIIDAVQSAHRDSHDDNHIGPPR